MVGWDVKYAMKIGSDKGKGKKAIKM